MGDETEPKQRVIPFSERRPMDITAVGDFFYLHDPENHEILQVPTISEYQEWLKIRIDLEVSEQSVAEMTQARETPEGAVMYAQGRRRHLAYLSRKYKSWRNIQSVDETMIDIAFLKQRYETFCTWAVAELNS